MAKCILITGMSGTGKSTTLAELRTRGYQAVDMDESGWSEFGSEGDWRWREDRLQDLLSSLQNDDILFVSGCAENQGKFYPQFDHIVLLSAPTDTIIERLKTRTTNDYGKHPDELAETLNYIETVEPLLRKGATCEIDTSKPLSEVVTIILKLLNH